MKQLTESYHTNLIKDLKDPLEAAEYLNAALQDSNQEIFLMALRDVAEARGIMKITKPARSDSEDMYPLKTDDRNPKLSSLTALLDDLGLKLAIEIKELRSAHSI